MKFIEFESVKRPSIYDREIRSKLLTSNICTAENVPSKTSINKVRHQYLDMTFKKISQIPEETTRPNHEDTVTRFIAKMTNFTPQQMHFFDEASVISTSGNRSYGHSTIGKKAYEVQRYASNKTFTVNACCGYFGLDYFDVLEGPSNAMEMLSFFEEALRQTNDLGNRVFARGDVVVMDNCGFHHQRAGERILRTMLDNAGVELVFQPPYSPQYNIAECVFHAMRCRLRDNTSFTENFTELAIVTALGDIPNRELANYFRLCGYV